MPECASDLMPTTRASDPTRASNPTRASDPTRAGDPTCKAA